MPPADLVIGMATQSPSTGRAAQRRGGRFALDRACPHVDFQQQLTREEADQVGAAFVPEPAWFRERQIAEYETADMILTPSHFTAQSFPAGLREKCVIAPLLGRVSAKGQTHPARNTPFTVGVLGGDPLRKGYLYLLQAWKRLALPNARLIIRSSSDFLKFPRLQELLRELPSVEIVEYIPNIAEFYQRCDLFVLPSVDDGFGMALFEAMANGVPGISTRNCGASELLVDGSEGIVIDARSVDQLAASILKLYEDEDLRRQIALAGQKAVERITAACSTARTRSSPPFCPLPESPSPLLKARLPPQPGKRTHVDILLLIVGHRLAPLLYELRLLRRPRYRRAAAPTLVERPPCRDALPLRRARAGSPARQRPRAALSLHQERLPSPRVRPARRLHAAPGGTLQGPGLRALHPRDHSQPDVEALPRLAPALATQLGRGGADL
jgi:hypothetical protein